MSGESEVSEYIDELKAEIKRLRAALKEKDKQIDRIIGLAEKMENPRIVISNPQTFPMVPIDPYNPEAPYPQIFCSSEGEPENA